LLRFCDHHAGIFAIGFNFPHFESLALRDASVICDDVFSVSSTPLPFILALLLPTINIEHLPGIAGQEQRVAAAMVFFEVEFCIGK
jgi:hypothetical protein